MANGVVPLLNVFTRPETAWQTVLLTGGIILFEAWMFRRLFRAESYRYWLRPSAFINVASSLAGSLYLWMFKEPWQTVAFGSGSLIELFVVTVVVEAAVLWRLLGADKPEFRTIVLRSVTVNLASYAILFALQLAVAFTLIGSGSRIDQQRLAQWRDPAALEGTTGYIYAFTRETNSARFNFRRFDVLTQHWESFPAKAPEFNPLAWDVVGDTLACFPGTRNYGGTEIRIFRLPDFQTIRVIPLDSSAVSLSPNARFIAVLADSGEAVAQRDRSSYYEFGRKGVLKIFEIATGNLIAESRRIALNRGLSWSGNGREVFFVSLIDETKLDFHRDQMSGATSYRRAFFEGEFAQGIYALSVPQVQTRFVTRGNYPAVLLRTGELWFRTEQEMFVRGADGNERSVTFQDLPIAPPSFSPDGKCSVISVQRKTPFQGGSFLTVFRHSTPEKRLIIDTTSVYHHRWADAPTATTIKQ